MHAMPCMHGMHGMHAMHAMHAWHACMACLHGMPCIHGMPCMHAMHGMSSMHVQTYAGKRGGSGRWGGGHRCGEEWTRRGRTLLRKGRGGGVETLLRSTNITLHFFGDMWSLFPSHGCHVIRVVTHPPIHPLGLRVSSTILKNGLLCAGVRH